MELLMATHDTVVRNTNDPKVDSFSFKSDEPPVRLQDLLTY